jgi:hypothetical protein
MLITYKITYAMFTTNILACSSPPRQCCQPPNAGPPFMPTSIPSTHQFKLQQKNENDYDELYISILARFLQLIKTFIFIMLLGLMK